MRGQIIYAAILVLLFACDSTYRSSNTSVSDSGELAIGDSQVFSSLASPIPSVPFFDTIIALKGLESIDNNQQQIVPEEAQSFLYKFYRDKGVVNRTDLRVTAERYANELCVEFDTIYPMQIRHLSGAIISYWLGACDLNGHCFQPTKAIVFKTDEGMTMNNIDFIPNSILVETVRDSTVYGEDTDCSGREPRRKIRS